MGYKGILRLRYLPYEHKELIMHGKYAASATDMRADQIPLWLKIV